MSRFFRAFFLVLAALQALPALFLLLVSVQQQVLWSPVEGVVTRDAEGPYVNVAFTTRAGERQETFLRYHSPVFTPRLKAGEPIVLLYHETSPSSAVERSFAGLFAPAMPHVLAVLILGYLAWGFHRRVKRQRDLLTLPSERS